MLQRDVLNVLRARSAALLLDMFYNLDMSQQKFSFFFSGVLKHEHKPLVGVDVEPNIITTL